METTINIQVELLNKITSTARSKGISRSKLIIILLEKMMEKPSLPPRLGRLVEYQERRGTKDRHPFHISFREDEYEYFQDLRKLLKMSLSLVLAHAVKKYLGDQLGDIITDNYLFHNYLIIKEMVDSIICWKLYWGYPPGIRPYL